ncbi:UNVERIFIED_CONTAM: peptide chain release factor C12orf65-like protein [Trichonephila clavipes]
MQDNAEEQTRFFGMHWMKISLCEYFSLIPSIVVKCHESRLLQENQQIARERLLNQLDEYYNGEMSIAAQKKRIEKMKENSQNAKRQKLRELKQNFLNSNLVNKS